MKEQLSQGDTTEATFDGGKAISEAFEATVETPDQIALRERMANVPVRIGGNDRKYGYEIDDRGHRYYSYGFELSIPQRMTGLRGRSADEYTLRQLRANDARIDHNVQEEIDKIKEILADKLQDGIWWQAYENDELYRYNPVAEGELHDQVRFSEGGETMTLFNYSEDLLPETIEIMRTCIDELSQMTNGRIYDMAPTIVIHDVFKETYFKTYDKEAEPGGRAYGTSRMIEINGSVIARLQEYLKLRQNSIEPDENTEAHIAKATKRLQAILVHELGHEIDAALNYGRMSSFGRFFSYEESEESDRLLAVTPKPNSFTQWRTRQPLYCAEAIEDSVPTRNYGHTNIAEDFATSMELFILAPNSLDPLRREAILQILSYKGNEPVVALNRAHTSARYIPKDEVRPPSIDDLKVPEYLAIHARMVGDERLG